MTNDGELANRLMHPKYEFKKAYEVELDKPLTEHDGLTAACEIIAFPNTKRRQVGVVLREGRNRQVKRMFEKLGYQIKKLRRAAYGDITTEALARGEWRYLTKAEVKALKQKVGLS